MDRFIIFTDTGCDIDAGRLRDWEVPFIDLKFCFEDGRELVTAEMPVGEFYGRMRSGGVSRTSAANPEDFLAAFEPVLRDGTDILYLGFSSGLSNTVNAGVMAASELRERYPERRVEVVDTLCASGGQGMAVYLAVQKKAEGAGLEETAAYVRSFLPHLCHWFTVDDLVYLKRGGRVSAATAFFGGVLSIKPVLHVDDEGHLINMQKARGRKQSVKALAEKYDELALDREKGVYFISHGDCMEDAEALADRIFRKYGNRPRLITDIGPVIGSHSGPGTLAIFFLGEHR